MHIHFYYHYDCTPCLYYHCTYNKNNILSFSLSNINYVIIQDPVKEIEGLATFLGVHDPDLVEIVAEETKFENMRDVKLHLPDKMAKIFEDGKGIANLYRQGIL